MRPSNDTYAITQNKTSLRNTEYNNIEVHVIGTHPETRVLRDIKTHVNILTGKENG